MSIGFGIAIFFVVWWIVLFAVLPFGVRTQGEAGETEEDGCGFHLLIPVRCMDVEWPGPCGAPGGGIIGCHGT